MRHSKLSEHMNKTISFLNELYGIPEQLLNEVVNFGIEPIIE